MRPSLVGIFVISALVTSCATLPPVRVVGSRGDIETLTGTWSGTYESRDTQREGSIWFALSADPEHAQGDVLMTPRGRGESYGRQRAEFEVRGSKQLTIRFVMVGDHLVEGVLDSYWDPDFQSQASTSFQGRVSGDVITGEFVTYWMSGAVAHGRWSVNRRR